MAARLGHNKTIFCFQVLVDGPYNLPLSLYILVTSYISLSAGIKKLSLQKRYIPNSFKYFYFYSLQLKDFSK